MSSVAIGPFIGSFEYEITMFAPYVRYIHSVVDDNVDVHISTYSNRLFLYDWIDDDKKHSVNERLSRNDCKQIGVIHEDINLKKYNEYVTSFKKSINNNPVEIYHLPYNKTNVLFTYTQKIFSPYRYPHNEIEENDFIVFIPDISISEDKSLEIYNELIKYYNVLVIGDCKTHIPEYNILMKRKDYVEKVYELIFNYIHKAKFVVTPCSYWTFLCNLQGVPIFSWGEHPSIYKSNGIFGFDNNNMIIYGDGRIDIILRSIEYFNNKCNRSENDLRISM